MKIRGISLAFSALLTLMLCACSQVGTTSEAQPFQATPVGPGVYKVAINMSGAAPAAGSMMVLCASAQLTFDQGFQFFRITDRKILSKGRGAYTLLMTDTPEEGIPVVDMGSSGDGSAADSEDFYLEAGSAVRGCQETGFDAYETSE